MGNGNAAGKKNKGGGGGALNGDTGRRGSATTGGQGKHVLTKEKEGGGEKGDCVLM